MTTTTQILTETQFTRPRIPIQFQLALQRNATMERTALASIDRALAHIMAALNSGCTEALHVSQFLTLYLEWGLSEIVRLDGHERLDLSLMDDEQRSETIIARERGHFVRIVVHEKLTFAPFNRVRTTKAKDRITQQEYNELRGDKPTLDASVALAMPRTAKDREDLRARLWLEFLATAPICSICQTPMKFKKSKNGPFWGCRIYPKCLSNSSFSPSSQEAYEKWQNT